ncbi:hypothetical protein PRUPE_6G281200 [Prunus persica]|uniref:Leucine-rich repeat-containing N-terminal plant-type domain-containing protein n=2 Tax=Prunus persica TaxID=3760 RepID=A0A251NWU1_PRUPE|nr:hypothetical protein PRUPE_6G281200 [Prunus persica]
MKTLLQYFFLFFITAICVNIIPAVHSQCIKNQQLSLLQLKKSLTFYNDSSGYSPLSSTKVISWNSSTDCCSWVGVTCSTSGHVVGLDISSECITGGIDNSSSLFDLQHLQILNLANNKLGSVDHSIPSAIGKLTDLRYLNLSKTDYSGQIPIEISRLKKLVVLDISNIYNSLKIPNLRMLFHNLTELTELYLDDVDISAQGAQWCEAISSSLPNLRVLSMSGTNLSGPIDQSLAKIQSLSVIRLDFNYISGPIPAFFANFSNLTVLSLDFNSISAPIPGFFANYSKLSSLSLKYCQLQGSFPKEIFQVPTLQNIDLSHNLDLEGSLPEFPKNGSLRSLILRWTNFSGFLPNSIGNLKMLSTIDLSGCSFTGSIPKSMENLTELVSLYMPSQRLQGPVDFIHWENLVNLVHLQLEFNLLNGSIPSSIFSSPVLKELLLSHNQFSGQLHEFHNVSSNLITLDLSFNNLEGPIPVSILSFRGLYTLDLSSNNFTRFPFNGPQQLRNLSTIDLSHNSLLVLYNGSSSSSSSFPQIQDMNLASNKLRTFPNFLRNHIYLERLDLSENQIQGMVPNWIWGISSLSQLNLSSNSFSTLERPLPKNSSVSALDLHSNQLQGQIPFFSPSARYLDYSKNCFSSSIPTDIGDFLASTVFLSLSSNNLHGLIPVSICNAGYEVLDMSNNSLSGMVPQCLTEMKSLRVLILRKNNLNGTLSNRFTGYCGLRALDLGRNQIKGQLPKSLASCTNLEILNLGNNQIIDTFPCFLKSISTLRVLVLRSNRFYGGIGCSKTNGTWQMLQIVDLAHNNFNGEIPERSLTTWQAMTADEDGSRPKSNVLSSEGGQYTGAVYSFKDAITVTSKGSEMDLVKILTIFTLIDFSDNKFNGSIPEEMGVLKSLYILNLSSNAITGEIPSSLGNMRQLESLDLSQNKLSGHIPQQLTKLTFLAFLNLSNNQLGGMIPTSNQFSTFPPSSFTGNKGLSGPPLDNKTGLPPPPPTRNGSLPDSGSGHNEIDWDLISIEIGFTFGCAIAIGSLVFCKRWSKWYYRAMYSILVKIFPQLEERLGNHRRHVHINQRWRR